MTDQPDKLDLRSHDIAEDKQQELLRLFPEIRTEGGKLDFERLKLALGESVDVGKERYGMTWPGKADCFKTIQMPSLGTLRPCPEESVDFETTENLIIEGDNLEVLKLLRKSYLGKVKMIYIDPPYNTGNDFIYPDNYNESLQTYLEYTGQVDAEGKKFSTNAETDGRFHSKWLNMMYPRLYLARNLLREDGVIFISIDGHEADNLRRICNEVFGEEHLVCSFAWEKRYSPPPDTKEVGYVHEEIVFYRRSDRYRMGLLPFTDEQKARYKNPDNDYRGPWKAMDYTCRYTAEERPNLYYPIKNPTTGEDVWPKTTRVWAFSKAVHEKNEAERRIWWGADGRASTPALKNFISEVQQGMMPMSLLHHDVVGNTDEATKELREFFPDLKYTPKPIRLLKHLALIANARETDIVLDFFAGSGTTAHAVLSLNKQDGGTRKFILVQLPEPTEHKDYPTIAEITKERVRRVIKKLNDEDAGKLDLEGAKPQDRGFKVSKLAESNFKPWNAEAPHEVGSLEKQLDLHVDHIREGRTADDLLYELLLKSGYPLTAPVEVLQLAGKQVHSVAGGVFFVCLERELTVELIRAMADKKPERVVCLDEGFAGNDQLKANAVQIFKTKGVTSFKTV
jgi:adenine-specific DNA-methyltransferase